MKYRELIHLVFFMKYNHSMNATKGFSEVEIPQKAPEYQFGFADALFLNVLSISKMFFQETFQKDFF